jgi:hypothetical protein
MAHMTRLADSSVIWALFCRRRSPNHRGGVCHWHHRGCGSRGNRGSRR